MHVVSAGTSLFQCASPSTLPVPVGSRVCLVNGDARQSNCKNDRREVACFGRKVAMEPNLQHPLTILCVVLASRVLSAEGSLTACELHVSVLLAPIAHQGYFDTQ